jgi:hypothetical protein
MASNTVAAARSASPLGLQNKNIKIDKNPLKKYTHIFILKRSANLKGVVINTYICYTY